MSLDRAHTKRRRFLSRNKDVTRGAGFLRVAEARERERLVGLLLRRGHELARHEPAAEVEALHTPRAISLSTRDALGRTKGSLSIERERERRGRGGRSGFFHPFPTTPHGRVRRWVSTPPAAFKRVVRAFSTGEASRLLASVSSRERERERDFWCVDTRTRCRKRHTHRMQKETRLETRPTWLSRAARHAPARPPREARAARTCRGASLVGRRFRNARFFTSRAFPLHTQSRRAPERRGVGAIELLYRTSSVVARDRETERENIMTLLSFKRVDTTLEQHTPRGQCEYKTHTRHGTRTRRSRRGQREDHDLSRVWAPRTRAASALLTTSFEST